MVHEDRQSVGIVIQQEPRGYIVATYVLIFEPIIQGLQRMLVYKIS